MLRGLLALLVLANLLFFAWTQGWLDAVAPAPQHAQHEPARLGAQVRPEVVVVLPGRDGRPAASGPASGAASGVADAAAAACLESGPHGDAEVAAVEAALAAAGIAPGSWARESAAREATWVIFAGRYPDAAARQAREDELRRLGLPVEVLEAPAELAPGLVISRHASRDAAELALVAVADKAVKDVRVAALPAAPLQHWLRVATADADQQARLAALDRGFRPCGLRR
jgi:hypothetical protein